MTFFSNINRGGNVFVSIFSYLPYWRLCDKIFKWIIGSDGCEVFVQNPNFLLVIPSRWTEKQKENTVHVQPLKGTQDFMANYLQKRLK